MSESMSCAILFWGVNKPTSFGKLHSSVYHGDLYLFYAIINLILISCDLLYSTNWTISYPSIALSLSCRLSRSTLIGIKSATWPNRRQPIRIGWPLCCRRRRCCCCWSTPAQRTRRFRVQMVSRIHNWIHIHIQLEIWCSTALKARRRARAWLLQVGPETLRINQSVYNCNYTDRHEHRQTLVYGQNGCWAWARQIVFDFRRFNWFCLLSLASYLPKYN